MTALQFRFNLTRWNSTGASDILRFTCRSSARGGLWLGIWGFGFCPLASKLEASCCACCSTCLYSPDLHHLTLHHTVHAAAAAPAVLHGSQQALSLPVSLLQYQLINSTMAAIKALQARCLNISVIQVKPGAVSLGLYLSTCCGHLK